MFGVGDALVGAGTPFATVAVGWSVSSDRLQCGASFLVISEGEWERLREVDRDPVGSSAIWVTIDKLLVLFGREFG
jgi:hypothetical protein